MDAELTVTDRELLRFEQRWPKHSVAKEAAIRAEFALSTPRYYQQLLRLVRRPDVVAQDPLLAAGVRSRAQPRPMLGNFAKDSQAWPVTSSGAFELPT